MMLRPAEAADGPAVEALLRARGLSSQGVAQRPGSREQGVGQRLCEELMRQLVQLGSCQAFSRIALPNEAGIRLHEALGFEPLGVFRKVGFKNGAWRDVSWWQRQLQALPTPPAEPARPARAPARPSRADAHGAASMA